VGRATLRALAALQGRVTDPETDEEPGRIVHEYWPRVPERLRAAGWPVRGDELRYYGSADATPWFLVVLAALDDDALSQELDASWRAPGAGSSARWGAAAGSSATARGFGRADSSSRAGVTRSTRCTPIPTAGESCGWTEASRAPRLPTLTRRPSPWSACGLSHA
jgi:glycogen debranching enzyme